MGFVVAVMTQSPISIVRELGDSDSLCSGMAMAAAIMAGEFDCMAASRSERRVEGQE